MNEKIQTFLDNLNSIEENHRQEKSGYIRKRDIARQHARENGIDENSCFWGCAFDTGSDFKARCYYGTPISICPCEHYLEETPFSRALRALKIPPTMLDELTFYLGYIDIRTIPEFQQTKLLEILSQIREARIAK